MKNLINIAPYGGLCNRLRVMASAAQFCIDKKRPINIYWQWERACNIKFHQLFEPVDNIPGLQILDSNRLDMQRNRRINLSLPKYLRKIEGVTDLGTIPYSLIEETASFIPDSGNIYMSCAHYFYKCNMPLRNIFRPATVVKKRLDKAIASFQPNTIGVHIRRTDNVDAIKTSPLSFFEENIQKEIDKDPSVTFFLATDDIKVKEDFKQKFGDRIITYDAELSRCSNNGMIDSLVELLCLASTCKIIGSFNSSFNEFSAAYNNLELILPGRVLTKDYLGFWRE